MIKFLLSATLLLFSSSKLFSQDMEDDESCLPPNKKVMKALKPSFEAKVDFKTKSFAYIEAIKLAPDNAYVRFLKAETFYKRAVDLDNQYQEGKGSYNTLVKSYKGAQKAYLTVINLCSDYHASPYYKIGLIYYLLEDDVNAIKYWKLFLAFNHKDPEKYPDDYSKWKKDVTDILQEIEGDQKALDTFFATTVEFKPHIVNGVSSKNDEFLPMISPDNELMFFTRRGDEKRLGDIQSNVKERFSASVRQNTMANFDAGKMIGGPFNAEEFNDFGGVTLSLDNKEMFICGCKIETVYGQKYENCDIYVSYFTRSGKGGNDYSWSELENLGTAINTKDGWEAQPTLSADGNTLYFSAMRATTQNTDIYYATRNEQGGWNKAKPVDVINTAGHDKTPFLHQDSETMYFSSQTSSTRIGSPEYGNFDMFYSRMDENGKWTEPKNLGHPINTKKNEVGFIVSTDGHLAYFVSDKQTENVGGLDVYYFELYEEARPQKVAMIKGTVTDEKGEPLVDATVEISYKDTGESVKIKVNGDDGKFAAIINVKEPQDVMVTVKKEGHSFDTKLIKKESIETLKTEDKTFIEEEVTMEIGKIEVGKSFTIDNILFATNSFVLNSDSKFILDQFIKFLKENPTVKVTIEGHTDDLGDDIENMTLSKQRANSSLQYITSKGIQSSRLKAKGYGETKPKVANTSALNRSKNRRTDFLITGM